MKRVPLIVIALLAVAGIVVLVMPPSRPSGAPPLTCYVGGTMTPVFGELAAAYEKSGGGKVEITSADSGELLATIEMQLRGDLYVAHDPFMDITMRRGLGVSAWCLGELYPVMVVQKGNPKGINSLKDLYRPDVRVILTDPEHSTLGRILPVIFERAGLSLAELNRIKQIGTHRSGSWVANQVIMQSADVALVWQVVAGLRAKDLDAVPIDDALPVPGVDAITSATGKQYFVAPVKVTVVTLACSTQQRESEKFVAFVTSETGKDIFRKHGFKVSDIYGRREYADGTRVGQP
jgi:molybdate transport system substrate-binding protein